MESSLPSSFNFNWPPTRRLAKSPFDDSRADIIIRSNDSMDFRVFKIILSLISPVFSEKFNAASRGPRAGDASAVLVVPLPEDSETLDLALRHCYPTRSPELSRLRDAQVLLEFARRYEVDALEPFLRKYLASAIGKDPVGVYALAAKYAYKDIASAAAKASLQLPLPRLASSELTSIGAEMYQQLIIYHSSCGEAASAVTLRRDWFPSGNKWLSTWPFSQSEDSSCCMMRDIVQDRPISDSQPSSPRIAPRYLWSYLHRSALVLAYQPNVAAVTTEEFVLKDLDCSVCVNFRRTDMLEFSRVFGAEIKRVIEQVGSHSSQVFGDIGLIKNGYSCVWQVPFTEKGSGSKTSAFLSASSTSAFGEEIKKGVEQVSSHSANFFGGKLID
jgi:hypothetical protein